jgi:hypothetical protein
MFFRILALYKTSDVLAVSLFCDTGPSCPARLAESPFYENPLCDPGAIIIFPTPEGAAACCQER